MTQINPMAIAGEGHVVDVASFENAINRMDQSRGKMYDSIINIRNATNRINEAWSGRDKDAFITSFNQVQQIMFNEQKRLNAFTIQMKQYLKELREIEGANARAVSSIGGNQ